MRKLEIDIETFSDTDLSKAGVYKYTESAAFDILLFGYSVDGGVVKVVDLTAGEEVPEAVLDALTDNTVIKWAHNSQFERICLSAWLRRNHPDKFRSYSINEDTVTGYLDPEGWRCSMVWAEYHLDQEINDRGIQIDLDVARNAIAMDERARSVLTAQLKDLTGLENPNSVLQMREFLSAHGIKTDSLGKKQVKELINEVPDDMKEVLMLRQKLAKSSVRKYQAMETAVCCDGRARGMFQFYGANRSGRWAGRIIQLQNLPQNHMPDLAEARELVKAGDYDAVTMLYDSVPDVLSELIRTAFVPRPGFKFIVSDFSAIEARVLAWLAGEQ